MTENTLIKDGTNVTDPTTHSDFQGDRFDPAEYNKTYYSEVMQDEAALINWQAGPLDARIRAHQQSLGIDRYDLQFDAGSGPSVHHLFALEKYSKQILLSDFMPENLTEIEDWVAGDPASHNWEHFVRAILTAENADTSSEAIANRIAAVRAKIITRANGGYLPLDLKEPVPANYRSLFVSSFFVADSATDDPNVFVDMTQNAMRIVEPGGLYLAAFLGGCKQYAVGDQWVNSTDLDQETLQLALEAGGGTDIQITRFDTPEMAPEGFNHIFAATAIKAS